MSSKNVVVKSSLSMPSFSSFDPVRLSAPTARDAALLDILDRSDSGESGEVSGTDRKSKKRKKSKKDKSGKKHRRKELRDAAPRDDTKPPPFYKDRVGDSLNLTYGTIHGSAIPMYKCLGGLF